MRLVGVFLLALVAILSGCATWTDYMVHYKSVPPFHPDDPNELLAELTGGLPADLEIRSFLHHRRTDAMHGLVLLHGARTRDAVCEAIRRNPRLSFVGPAARQVHPDGESLVCFSSVPPFVPGDAQELLARLQQGLPPEVKPRILAWRRADDGLSLWIIVNGNFNKEAVKFALRQNPNLRLLQVEGAPPFPHLSFWLATHLSDREAKWQLYD